MPLRLSEDPVDTENMLKEVIEWYQADVDFFFAECPQAFGNHLAKRFPVNRLVSFRQPA